MDVDQADMPHSQETSASRACDNCRIRKIKCDRGSPCSNCRTSESTCRTSPRVKEQRQRILISHQYEKKIEIIDQRLAGIEQLLRDLTVNINNNNKSLSQQQQQKPRSSRDFRLDGSDGGHAAEQRSLPSLPLPTTLPAAEEAPPPPRANLTTRKKTNQNPEYEGETSMTAHSAHASELFEKAVVKTPLAEHSPEIMDALSALKDIVARQKLPSSIHTLRFAGQKPTAGKIDLSALELPPLDAVLSLLRKAKETTPFFLLNLPFLDVPSITQLCKDLYFCTEDYSTAHFAIVNCTLSYMFDEARYFHEPVENQATSSSLSTSISSPASTYSRHATTCRLNFETALNTFDLSLTPSYENIIALALGAFHATELSKPSLCWVYTSAAARMCQSLGWHHTVSGPGISEEEANAKRTLFWFIYVLDKDLMLLLGRSSTLQDYDIALEFPGPPADERNRPWYSMYGIWITYSKIAARIYEQLYSVRALGEEARVRGERAEELAREVEVWKEGYVPFEPSPTTPHSSFFRYAAAMADLSYNHLLTIIYRAKPAPAPLPTNPHDPTTTTTRSSLDPACVNAARNALRLHQQFVADFHNNEPNDYLWRGYIVWSLLHCPFTPYLVLFTHTIATASLDDLALLEQVSNSLESARDISEGGERLFRLCAVFFQVARLYVEVRMREGNQQQQQTVAGNIGRGGGGVGFGGDTGVEGAGRSRGIGGGGGGAAAAAGGQTDPQWQWDADEVDSYLWELGFGPPAGGMMNMGNNGMGQMQHQQQQQQAENGVAVGGGSGGMSPTLQDWFRGNQYMMELLESDYL
ncbi:hypothetical protein AJ79_06048 [Helicocarpus griseus UAMH5409]|uniref:Zn(2)-C6 fungal-type domain-containing protein n=1 Tax=Helicocarpus griseus UAMH5409 TaxID=1447875 RepID=A0A2B7XHT2_9EURO|nr:hypothetical protein AJ79_06048 [Helicocarpus griseus UAMH5409]